MESRVNIASGPAGYCPVEAEGDIDGHPFYFRSRGQHWSLHVASSTTADPLDDDAWVHREKYDGVNLQEVPNEPDLYAAGYAQPEECRAFIFRVAQLWLDRRQKGTA